MSQRRHPLPLQLQLRRLADPVQAQNLRRFFKTGPGQYGEGDQFLGLKVPQVRTFVGQGKSLSWPQLLQILHSPYHEERLLALLIMVTRKGHECYDHYLANTACINNWDLVDCSAPDIVGRWLLERDRSIVYQLVQSPSLWERRIAVLASFAWIRQGQGEDTLALCQALLHDRHDLMHKACGWMLRELGKRQLPLLLGFLDQHADHMPRTMLRYSLEKLDPTQRQHYMQLRSSR